MLDIEDLLEWAGIFVTCDITMLVFMKLLTFVAYACGLSDIGELGTLIGCVVSMIFAIAAIIALLIAIVIKVCKGRKALNER